MWDFDERTARILGEEGCEKLARGKVAVFGVGGVGGFAVEALVRAGIGAIDLIDADDVSLSNLNRQIIATRKTVGQPKVDAFAARIREINPGCVVRTHKTFVLPENVGKFDFSAYSYVVDAVDTVSAKIAIISAAKAAGVPVVSAMGAAGKLDPTKFAVADIEKTSVCPLARVVRAELRRRGIRGVKVVYSTEEPQRSPTPCESSAASEAPGAENSAPADPRAAKDLRTPGSLSFVPSVMGLILAGEVIKDLAR